MNTQRVVGLSLVIMVLLGMWGVMRWGYTTYEKIQYPYMLNLGEPPLTQAIQTLHRGENPYRELSSPPYSLVPYGPVYTGLSSLIFYLTERPFVGGRILCFLASCLAALTVFGITRRMGVRRLVSVVAAALFLLNPYVQRWSVQVNVDMLGVAVSGAALYCLMRYYQTRSQTKPQSKWSGTLILGGVLAVVAFFTKSSCLMGAAAFFITLMLKRDFRLALGFFVVTAGSAGLIYAWLNLLTGGQYYFHTTYEISQRLYFWQFLYRFWWDALKDIPISVVGTLIYLLWCIKRRSFDFVFWYVVCTILVTASLGKQGSDTNYLLPWLLSSSIALGLLLNRLVSAKRIWPWLACGVFLWQMTAWSYPALPLTAAKGSFTEQREYYDQISKIINQTPGKILSQDMGLLIANGRVIYYEPFPMGQMSYSGVWDQQLILDELNAKEYSLVILFTYAPLLKADRNFTPEFMKAFNANYEFKARSKMPGFDNPASLFFFEPKET